MHQKLQSQGQPSDTTNQIDQAYQMWRARQDRCTHPTGSFDTQGRWYPVASEQCSCCASIRHPSAAYRYSLLTHCRSAEHVANLCGVSAKALRARIAQERGVAKREGGETYFKAVAVKDGCFYSIYDGETEYALGEIITERGKDMAAVSTCTERNKRRGVPMCQMRQSCWMLPVSSCV